MVEAPGIEPGSGDLPPRASTRVVRVLNLAFWSPADRVPEDQLV